MNPYSDLGDHQFWRRSISQVERSEIDPVVNPRFLIDPQAKVATAGSCFAQHIARQLSQIGFNYLVTEDGDDLPNQERRDRQFGVYSARFGNIYTTAQLRQLFEEAFGTRVPAERVWQRADGAFVDPYRQQVEPAGFASPEALLADRATHLEAVRRMFCECDILIFTLGLTEGWRSRVDGSVFPLAPGVAAGAFDPEAHEFVNFGVDQVHADLRAFLLALREVNPGAKILLTVSPVPLIATYEPRSVLCSTVYSKSVLRVAAEMARAEFSHVDYFPSFEIVTGNHAQGAYFNEDLREVNALGVSHVMRCFRNNLTSTDRPRLPVPVPFDIAAAQRMDILCDEEMIEVVRGGPAAGLHMRPPPVRRPRLQRWAGWVRRRLPWRQARR